MKQETKLAWEQWEALAGRVRQLVSQGRQCLQKQNAPKPGSYGINSIGGDIADQIYGEMKVNLQNSIKLLQTALEVMEEAERQRVKLRNRIKNES